MKRMLPCLLAVALLLAAMPLASAEAPTYPLASDAKLTWWIPMNSNISATAADMNELPYTKALIEYTGVDIEFVHPAMGQEQEQFNLMVASGKMTDIVEGSWLGWYTAGMDVAIENNLVYALNDHLDDWAPDFKAYLDTYEEVDKISKTDTGNYYGFTFIMIDDILKASSGPYIRKDWLDTVGLDIPETVDEWEEVLVAFRDTFDATAPLASEGSGLSMFWNEAIISAFGVTKEFYHVGDEVKFGPLEPGYKDFVLRMADWYAQGLINPNFVTDKSAERDTLFMNEDTGITFGYAQSGLNRLWMALQELNPEAECVAIPYPVMNKGETPMYGQKNFSVANTPVTVVNPNSANLETAVKVLNYMYTDAGTIFNNYGIEGESFEYVDGVPTMMDNILNPTDCTIGQEWAKYARSVYNGPFEQAAGFMLQYQTKDVLREALTIWSDTDTLEYKIPVVTMTTEESKVYTQIMSDVNAIIDEWVCAAIMGVADVNEFDTALTEQILSAGIEEALAIQQAAFDRYNAR